MHGRPAAVPALPAPGEHGTVRRGTARHGPAGSVLLTPCAPSCRSRRAALVARCLSAPCSAPSTTTNPSRARRPGTAGCPSTEVSTGTPRPWCSRDRGGGGCCRPHLNVPSSPSLLAPAAPNACDLNCLAVGHNFYYTFGRVLDGTRCGPDSPELCVGGRCLVGVRGDGIPGTPGTPKTPWDPPGPLGTLGPCPDAASRLLRASAATGSWARVRGPTPAAGAAAARTGASWCTGSSRARSPPPVNEPLPRPPPWVNALALGSPVPPSVPFVSPRLRLGPPGSLAALPGHLRGDPWGVPMVRGVPRGVWGSLGAPRTPWSISSAHGVLGRAVGMMTPMRVPRVSRCMAPVPSHRPLAHPAGVPALAPPPHNVPSAVPGPCPDSPPASRLFWVHERDQDPGWGHQHQGDRQEPQLPR